MHKLWLDLEDAGTDGWNSTCMCQKPHVGKISIWFIHLHVRERKATWMKWLHEWNRLNSVLLQLLYHARWQNRPFSHASSPAVFLLLICSPFQFAIRSLLSIGWLFNPHRGKLSRALLTHVGGANSTSLQLNHSAGFTTYRHICILMFVFLKFYTNTFHNNNICKFKKLNLWHTAPKGATPVN